MIAPRKPAMTHKFFTTPSVYTTKGKSTHFEIVLVRKDELEKYLKGGSKDKKATQARQLTQKQFNAIGYKGGVNKGAVAYDANSDIYKIFWGVRAQPTPTDGASLANFIASNFAASLLKAASFGLEMPHKIADVDLDNFCLGWGLASYRFDTYKKNTRTNPVLVWPDKANKKEVSAKLAAITMLRNLINTPANDLGTDDLAAAAKKLAQMYEAKVKITKGKELENNFPMIHNVGKASPRPPQLVDIKWGKAKDPKVTIVGKGIIYDTGGLNIKTGVGMRYMKKDMGGAAHALGVASMIMALKLPIQLRVLLPIAENAVAGNSYRPGDILPTRKGLSVEIDDTDAEGRLVLADALTYASEGKPDLLIDFATLTGAARVAIGYDIPAFFTNRDAYIDTLRHSSLRDHDFIWPFPLWEGYDQNIEGNVSDIISVGSGRAGHIEAALFLQRFVDNAVDWIHLDCYAWEQNGKAGRPQGGADTGAIAIFNFIKERYAR